ncbi:MAG: hypothetical protein MZU97_22585 [Bacillus subtilis]|nr:hypothetical protein [Bacillus subtilis]
MDEPTASIDKENIAYFQRAVNDLHDEGVNVILISHDESISRSIDTARADVGTTTSTIRS